MSINAINVLILNGPNLNLLGQREPNVYGKQTLQDIITNLQEEAHKVNIKLSHLQSNREYELIEKIHDAFEKIDFIIINPGPFTHTSIALRDALLGVNIPFIEVHLSNIHAREKFRQHSYLSDIAQGVICGLGAQGYSFALQSAHQYTTNKQNNT
ncbi:3-dehydroquinate dehydratase [Psychromonas sp. PRT-SC03]|nr:3-dehydroquinate dehydratase [Psychromonas sp. PRT-SC03]